MSCGLMQVMSFVQVAPSLHALMLHTLLEAVLAKVVN